MKAYLRALLIPLVLLFVVSILACAGTSQKRENDRSEGEIQLGEGTAALNQGNIELALFKLTKASRLIPDNPEVHFALGTVHLLREEPEMAMESFKRTIQIEKKHADAYNNLGFAYLKLGRWDEAIKASERALDEVSYDTPERAMTIIGWAYYKKGETGRGLNMLQRALKIKDNQPDTENRIATIYLEEGRVDKSKVILLDLVKRYPKFASARLNLGIVYYKERDFVAARREFRAVVDIVDRKSEEARLARGYLDLIE